MRTNPLFDFFEEDRPLIPADKSVWPDGWKRVEFKIYPESRQIALPKASLTDITLKKAILKRRSRRKFMPVPMALGDLSALLFFGAGICRPNENDNLSRRAYPSAGGLYPIETYVAVLRAEGLEHGLYHYNVKDHSLEFLSGGDIKNKIVSIFREEWVLESGAVFIFSLMPDRSTRKYGNFAFKSMLIEAGHIAENMYLIAATLKLKCCSLARVNRAGANAVLETDGIEEIPFYALAAGK